MAVYPTGTKVFSTKHNLTDTVYAADVNDIQDEMVAVQTALGVVPSRASSIISSSGKPVTKDYGTVASRLQSIQMGDDLPVAHIKCLNQKINGEKYTYLNFKKVRDSFGLFNGADFTIPVDAWVIVTANSKWEVNTNGFRSMMLADGSGSVYMEDQRPSTSWTDRNTQNFITWQGEVPAGTRLRIRMYQESERALIMQVADMRISILRRYPAFSI